MDEIFTQRLSELIKESNLTYNDLADKLGFKAKSTIWKYANGKISKIGPTGIYNIAKFFKVSPSWLAGFTDDKYYNIDFDKK